MEAVAKLIEQGKVRAAGVSNFSVAEIQAAGKIVPIASDQPPYSMVKRDIEKEILPHCRKNGVGVIVYSPLQLGLLSGGLTMERRFPDDDLRANSTYFKPANRRKVIDFLAALRPVAEAHKATIAQLVINWTIHRDGITAALVGARNPSQARENAGAADFRLNPDEKATVDAMVDGLTLET